MHHQTFLRRAALAGAAVLLAACGSSAATATPRAPATLASPSPAPAATFPLGSIAPGFSFTLPSEDKALEDLLPDDIGGAAITKSSMAGSSLVGAPGSDLSKVLGQLGKTESDISAAFGIGGGVSVGAYRLKGVDATTLLAAFAQMLSADEAPTISDANIGGKSVRQVVTATATIYVYTNDDVLFTVNKDPTGTDAAVAEAISKLP